MKNPHIAVFVAAAAVVSMVSSTAQAQTNAPSKLYAEIGYISLNLKETFAGDTFKASPSAIGGILGYQFMPNLAVEGLLGLGSGKDGITINGVESGADAKIASAFGVFVRPSVAVTESIDLFGRVGVVRNKLKVSSPVGSDSTSETGFAFGVGANFNLSKTSYIQANWMNYYKKDGFKVDGFGVSYGMRF